jgi:hypothetical protein
MKKTAIIAVTNPVAGDQITIADARGISYSFQLDTEQFRRQDERCLPVQIGKTNAQTANNLYRALRPLLAISGTVDAGGNMSLEQDFEGEVEPVVVTGESFVVIQDWA